MILFEQGQDQDKYSESTPTTETTNLERIHNIRRFVFGIRPHKCEVRKSRQGRQEPRDGSELYAEKFEVRQAVVQPRIQRNMQSR